MNPAAQVPHFALSILSFLPHIAYIYGRNVGDMIEHGKGDTCVDK